jgi:hypothetical protein
VKRLVVLLALLVATPAQAADPARARSCGWILEPSADRENVLFPDTGTRYLGGIVPVPPGGSVEITGRFPHARYMSLQTYSSTLQTATNLRDAQIRPDKGSTNPFLRGADRTAKKRSYTVHIVAGRPPTHPPPNTLYNTSPDGSKQGNNVAYRIYLPDRGAGPFGGVPAPKLAFIAADGHRIEPPTCPDPLIDVGITQALAGLGTPDLPLQSTDGNGLLAYPKPIWHKYVNAGTSYATGVTDTPALPGQTGTTATSITDKLPSGLGENYDNKYVYSYLSQEYGKVVMLRARLPRTPRTYEGERRMQSGQMRYWSMCTANRTTQTYGCQFDKDMPVDRHDVYTIAISTAANRPANATAACGVAWLPWGPEPKGIAFERNMLPRATFTHAVQNATPGTERKTLGAYYPRGTYFADAAAFEKRGCHRPAGFGRVSRRGS